MQLRYRKQRLFARAQRFVYVLGAQRAACYQQHKRVVVDTKKAPSVRARCVANAAPNRVSYHIIRRFFGNARRCLLIRQKHLVCVFRQMRIRKPHHRILFVHEQGNVQRVCCHPNRQAYIATKTYYCLGFCSFKPRHSLRARLCGMIQCANQRQRVLAVESAHVKRLIRNVFTRHKLRLDALKRSCEKYLIVVQF